MQKQCDNGTAAPWKLRPYEAVRPMMETGDCIAWSGKGFVPEIIRLATDSPVSHISSVIRVKDPACKLDVVFVAEAMIRGMELNFLSTRLRRQGGSVWWLPLSSVRKARLSKTSYVRFLIDAVRQGVEYDIPQAIRSARDMRKRFHSLADDSKLFCSESHCFALLRGGAIHGLNPSEATPQDVVSFAIHADDYYQIDEGPPVELPNYNTVDPYNWDV